MSGSGAQTIKIIPAIFLALLVSGLSASSFNNARAIATQNFQSLASWNLLASNRVKQLAELQARIIDHQTAYQKAYWPQQRQQVQMDLLALRKQKLNLTPYDAEDWLALLALLPAKTTLLPERLWLFESAIRTNKWRLQRRPQLAYYCIDYDDRLSAGLAQQCARLLVGLPWLNDLPVLARMVGVEQTRLELALSQAGVL